MEQATVEPDALGSQSPPDDVRKSKVSSRIDIPTESYPALPDALGGAVSAFSSNEARNSNASNSSNKSARIVNEDGTTPSAAAVDGNDDATSATEVYYVDSITGKAMVRKSLIHKGRLANITMEVNPHGQAINVVSGTAMLPGETPRQYFRQMSSFARWQLRDAPSNRGLSWDGDQKYPYFSYLVVVITGAILCAEIGINYGELNSNIFLMVGWKLTSDPGVEPFAVNPTFGPRRDVLLQLGAKRTDLILQGEFHRLIASWWLHGGVLHWLVNMIALYNLGFSLEKEFGTPKIMLIFCSCGFMGTLCSAVFLPHILGVGASGAIFGLFGACFADLIQNWGLYKSRGNAYSVLCQLIFGAVLNFLLGFLPMLDQFAHMGGFFTGVSREFVYPP